MDIQGTTGAEANSDPANGDTESDTVPDSDSSDPARWPPLTEQDKRDIGEILAPAMRRLQQKQIDREPGDRMAERSKEDHAWHILNMELGTINTTFDKLAELAGLQYQSKAAWTRAFDDPDMRNALTSARNIVSAVRTLKRKDLEE